MTWRERERERNERNESERNERDERNWVAEMLSFPINQPGLGSSHSEMLWITSEHLISISAASTGAAGHNSPPPYTRETLRERACVSLGGAINVLNLT